MLRGLQGYLRDGGLFWGIYKATIRVDYIVVCIIRIGFGGLAQYSMLQDKDV